MIVFRVVNYLSINWLTDWTIAVIYYTKTNRREISRIDEMDTYLYFIILCSDISLQIYNILYREDKKLEEK